MPDLDTKKIIEQINKNVNAIITEVASNQLITKVEKDSWEALLNDERNNVTTVLKSLDSIQQMLKLMEKKEINNVWWIDMVKLVRHNEKTKTITARVKLASIKAIINKIRNMYNLVWTQSPPLLSTPLLPPLRQSPSSLAEDNIKKWKLTLDKVKEYIDNNNKKPSSLYENKEIKKLGIWLSYQNYNYKKKIRNMKNKIVRKLWEDFINDDKYKKYFICNKEVWKKNLEFVKKYIDKNKKRPPQTSKNKNIKKHGQWLNNQLNNYKNKQKTMSNKTIRHLWEDFINQYKIYFKTH
jgi:hypothetical protein